MLKSLDIKNFTVFLDARLEFSPGLNVIIGDNATGKSHLLKLGYSVIHTLYQVGKTLNASQPKDNDIDFIFNKMQELENALPLPETKKSEQFKALKQLVELEAKQQAAMAAMKDKIDALPVHNRVNLEQLPQKLADKLHGVFKPDYLGCLNRNGTSPQRSQITVEFKMPDGNTETLPFSFANHSRNEVTVDQNFPHRLPEKLPLFFPTREVLTLHPSMTVLYEERYLSIDETHYDLCKALSLPLLKQLPNELTEIIKPLEAEMGGKVTVDKTGHFYFDMPNQGKMEISLIAEGLRKIAMLVYLIQNGSLGKGSILFWDETEANLNSRILVKMANALAALAQKGIQVILATHDLFLMKELSLLIESTPQMPAQFFSLRQDETGIAVEQGRLLEDLHTIVALDEALAQDDREQDFYYNNRIP
jgi:predicted ATPase